jgi:hypothetical protein
VPQQIARLRHGIDIAKFFIFIGNAIGCGALPGLKKRNALAADVKLKEL